MCDYLKNTFYWGGDFPGIFLVIVALLSAFFGCKKDSHNRWQIKHEVAPFFFLSAIFGLICDFSFRVSIPFIPFFKDSGISTLYFIPVFWFVFGFCFFLLALLSRNWVDVFLNPTSYFIRAGFSWKNVSEFLDSDIRIEKGKVIVNGTPWQEELSTSHLLKEMGKRIIVLSLFQPFGISVAEKLGVSLFCSWPSFFLFFLPLLMCLLYTIPFTCLFLYLLIFSPYLLLPQKKKE